MRQSVLWNNHIFCQSDLLVYYYSIHQFCCCFYMLLCLIFVISVYSDVIILGWYWIGHWYQCNTVGLWLEQFYKLNWWWSMLVRIYVAMNTLLLQVNGFTLTMIDRVNMEGGLGVTRCVCDGLGWGRCLLLMIGTEVLLSLEVPRTVQNADVYCYGWR